MPTTRTTTICFLLRSAGAGEVLLAMKKRGFGVGKWNGCGGKVEAGESIEAAAVRELNEEIGVSVAEHDMQKVAELTFYYKDTVVCSHVFTAERWTGEPAETDEMAPRWFTFAEIPYEKMWSDDVLWLPKVLAGEKVRAEFWFSLGDETVSRHTIEQLT